MSSPPPDALDVRVQLLAAELRCLVCQNQSIADSNAPLAVDLRAQIRELLQAGRSEADVRRFMTERYGDFILYRPPLDARTSVLWLGPGLMAAGGLLGLWALLRRRARLADDAFDPDTVLGSEAGAPDTSDMSGVPAARAHEGKALG